MGRKSKFTPEQKEKAVLDYKSGHYSIQEITSPLGIYSDTIWKWIAIYDSQGIEGFINANRNKSYSKEFKEKVVLSYINGEGSLLDLMKKYKLKGTRQIETWVMKYNSHEELKDYNPRGEVYMAEKRRKTTLQERIEIVKWCLEHDKSYKDAASEFDVSYAQVYQWVKNYIADGEQGLEDRRGKNKQDDELDEIELLKRKIARLERKLEEKERTVTVLKKVKEIERRRYSPKGNKNRNT